MHLDKKVEQRCEWSCILWSKDHWADQARKAKVDLEQARELLGTSLDRTNAAQTLFSNSQFLNTVAQVYSRLFSTGQENCRVKRFAECPFVGERQDLLNEGSLASIFVTVLQKATFYAMLDRHPLDSGLLEDEHLDVYGVNLTDFQDLERSLSDGRFENLYAAVLKRASELAGLR
jgi:hypothetical protein